MRISIIPALLSAILLIGLAGCVLNIFKKEAYIHVVRDSEMVKNCRALGTVHASTTKGWTRDQKIENSLNEVKYNALNLGANTVLIVSMDSMFEGVAVRGIAYDCPNNEE